MSYKEGGVGREPGGSPSSVGETKGKKKKLSGRNEGVGRERKIKEIERERDKSLV